MTLSVTTDRALINSTLISWLETYSGVGAGNVVWLNQAFSRPAKPYVGIVVLNRGIKTGFDDVISSYDIPTEKVQRITAGPRQLILQIEIYSDPSTDDTTPEADAMLENALLALDTELIRETFRAAKIGLLSHTPINRLDEQLGERWERRAQADVVITYSGETFDDGADSGNWIEGVKTDLIVSGQAAGVYLSVTPNGIYFLAPGETEPEETFPTNKSWTGIAVNELTGELYAAASVNHVYKQDKAFGEFARVTKTARAFNCVKVNPKNGDVYAAVLNGDIYKQTGGVGDFVALGQTTRVWTALAINTETGDVYACAFNADIYKQTGGQGNFVSIGAGSATWRGLAINSINGDIYAGQTSSPGDIYKQTGGLGSFVALGSGIANVEGIIIDTTDNSVWCCNNQYVFKQTEGVGSFNQVTTAPLGWTDIAIFN